MVNKTFGDKLGNVTYYERKGAYLIAIENNKLAVAKCYKGCFLIGGGMEKDEDQIDCLKREAIEETGHEVIVEGFVGSAESYSIHNYFGHFNPVQFYYHGRLGKKVCEPLNEGEEFTWIPLENFEDELYLEYQKWAVRKYLTDNGL